MLLPIQNHHQWKHILANLQIANSYNHKMQKNQ